MTPDAFFVQQQLQRVQASCRSAIAQIQRAQLVDLSRLMHVNCQGFLRPLAKRELTQVHDAGERRAGELLKPELDKLRTLTGPELDAQLRRLRQLQQSLRGDLIAQFHQVDRAIAQAERPSPTAPAAPPEA